MVLGLKGGLQGLHKTVAKSPMATIAIIWLQNIGYGDISGDKGRPATHRHSHFLSIEWRSFLCVITLIQDLSLVIFDKQFKHTWNFGLESG